MSYEVFYTPTPSDLKPYATLGISCWTELNNSCNMCIL